MRVDNAKSEEAEVLHGIPQGSLLGPILFTSVSYLGFKSDGTKGQ